MSAFLVSDKHIDEMLKFASAHRPASFGHPRVYHDNTIVMTLCMPDSLDEAGQELVNQNYKSLTARYKDDDAPHSYKYQQRPFSDVMSPVEVIKLCDCYNYQACETLDYYDTLAYSISKTIREAAIDALPGYDDASWSI